MNQFRVLALSVAMVILISPLAGCTLTPSHFDGYDLLDTGHKTENQDPVAVPVKEASDRPWVKSSPEKVEAPVFAKPAELKPEEKPPMKKIVKTEAPKTAVKPEVKTEIKTETKPVEKPDIKKEEVKTEAAKTGPEKPVVKADPCMEAKGGVLPPPRPDAIPATLKSGDRVKITVFREKDLTGDYQINDKGMITFPLVGQVQAAGVTPLQLQANLVSALSKGYLVKPDVNVERLPDCQSK